MKRSVESTHYDPDWREAPCRKCRTHLMRWWSFCPSCGQQLPSLLDSEIHKPVSGG